MKQNGVSIGELVRNLKVRSLLSLSTNHIINIGGLNPHASAFQVLKTRSVAGVASPQITPMKGFTQPLLHH